MKVTRTSVFETNSSSTHSICISKIKPTTLPKSIHFGFGEYGWENASVYETENYLYTGIIGLGLNECISKIQNILDKHNIAYTFATPKKTGYYECGYIDHANELYDFIIDVCNDEDKLLRYLFGDSVIYTGNDNSSEYSDSCNSVDEYIWDDNDVEIPNPNHDESKYEYYYKGN